jgi:Bacterial Ig-like domain/Carboxypeptidase regulatory-like domain/Bacterial Ig domain
LRTSPYSIVRTLVFVMLAMVCAKPSLPQTPQVKIGSLDLTIGGVQATVTPTKPVIPKNIASGVQVVVTQNGQQLSAAQVARYLGGPFQLAAEFSGPGLTQTIEVPQTPAAPNSLIINLPAVTTAGNYTLSNLRFIVNGSPVFDVSPSVITVQVIDQVLVTSVQTTPLTLDQIQQMGVVLNSGSYTGFQFNIALQLSSQAVNISFPVVFDQNGVAIPQPLSPPQVSPTGVSVPLPTIVPVLLQGTNGSGSQPTIVLSDGTEVPVKIPSVIVIPGNVGYLKQFFSAQLYVSNGAPAGSNLTVDNISGMINLPVANDGNPADAPLGLPLLTSGPQSVTENVFGPDPNGDYTVASLNPGDTGQAQWTIQGNQEGYYTINFNINATLEGLPTGPYDLTGTATGGVLVRNPYFDMTFTVPGVVRKGELFNVFATVSNISQVAANNLTVNFAQNSLSGVTLVSPPSPVIPTLNAGDSTTLTFQFQSLQTGQVVASYLNFLTQNGTTGNLNFTLGVYANGTPMSPDTLVLPSSVDNLPNDVVDAAMRVLGQAWSVATAPSLPASVLPTTKTVVTEKALALSEAGLRVSLGEPLPAALRDLGTDFFGGSPTGSPVDPGFDQVLRATPAGENFVSVLGANLAQPATLAGGAITYESQLAQVLSSGPNFISFAVGSGTGPAPVSVGLVNGAGNQFSSTTPGGTVVGGALFPLGRSGGVPYLGLITSPTNSPYTLLLTGQSSGSADISISIPSGSGSVVRGWLSGVAVVAGQQMRVVADLTNPNNLVLQVDTNGDGSFATSVPMNVQSVLPPGPTFISATMIGPETVSQAGPFGLNAVMLFDRIVDSTTSATPTNYTIPNNSVLSARKQLSGRLVFANLSQPEGPYVPTTWTVGGVADQRGVVGTTGTVTVQSFLQDPGAVVTGRVLNPDGTPSTTATVTYENSPYNPSCASAGQSGLAGLAATSVSTSGVYQFRYVHQDQCGGPFAMATTDPTTGAVRQVTTYVRAAGQQLVLDLALLGRGSVAGVVKGLSGTPVYNAQVAVVSVTDPQVGASTYTDANGNYTVSGITVGPVTVTAAKGISLGNSAGDIERAGTTAVVNVTLNGGAVNVSGTVTQVQGGAVTPVPGAPVVYYLLGVGANPLPVGVAITASDGSYAIQSMPTGAYSIIASLNTQLSASQSGVAAAGQNLSIPLQIVVPVTGTVNGKVTLPNGTGAAGVVVFQGSTGVLTNPDGSYSLAGVPVLPSQSQTITARTTDGLRSGYANVVVNSATTPVAANITLSGLGNAQFTVLDATGKPVPNQQVAIPTFGCTGISQTTNASGVATFTGLPVGTVHVIALLSQGNFQDLASGTATITSDGTTGFGTLQFHGAGTVTGSVIDPHSKPVLGAIVQLTSNYVDQNYCTLSQGVTQSVQTDSSGTFQFAQVNVGKVGVSASQSFYPTPVGAQGALTANGQTVNFPPLQLQNSTAGVLSGTIFLPDGVTPAGAGVQVIANGPLPNVTVNTDANGNYQFAAILPQGSYTLSASDPVSGGVDQMTVFLRPGQNMTQNMRLLGTATVNVTVVDGAGVAVSQAFVTLTENTYPFANFTGSLDASNQGVLPFPNVFEGTFSVQVTDSFGRGGRASGTIPQGTKSVNVQVQLTTTGSVQGHYYRPDGVTPIPNANVQLTANGVSIGQFTSLSTGDVGSFSFQYVPAGPVELKAQDPLTGYSGIAAGTITAQGQVLTLDVIAQGLDTIQGLVTSDGNPQPGAMVTVVSGTFQATTEADSNGMYLMQGVPEGVIVVTASLGNGFLSGTASAPINGDSNTLTLNVALRNSGTVTGQVVQYDGVTVAPTSTVTINVGGTGGGTETATTDTQGNFTLQNVPSGSGTISAQVLGGIDEASQPISVASGTTTNVKVQLNGTGVVSGIALDSSGNRTAGTINLNGTGAFPYYLTLTAASDGSFSVPQVLAGPYTAKLSANIGGFTLYGTATGSILPGKTTQITVQVQSSGTITGTVLRPDGVTPAVGANVTIQLLGSSQGGSVTLQVQSDGTFTALGVPLGSFSVLINDPSTNGIAAIEGQSISTNGSVANLGRITLDGNALSVVSSNPANGATGVGVTQPLSITFSEALASSYGIFVMNGTSNLNVGSTLSSDGRTVTLQGQLPDGVPLTINVTTQVTDAFGRQLLQPQMIQFTTVDLTPPYVISVSPLNGAIQVPVTASLVVNFNKALSTAAQPANVIILSGGGSTVPGTTVLTASNVLTFTPSVPLASNTLYTVNENGAVSFGGNVQTIGFMSSFTSPETTAPLLQLNSPANGGYVNTPEPTISILYGDTLSGINTATAALSIDGQSVAPIVGPISMSFTPTTALANGSHTISASVQNNAGVMGALSASFTVDTSSPSVAVLTGITTNQVLKGQITVSASASDSISGIAKINVFVDGMTQATLTSPTFAGILDTTRIADGPHSFTVQAVSNGGNSGPVSAAIQAYIENVPLSVTIISPANGAPFKGAVTVTAVPSEPVQSISFTLGTQTVTATALPYTGTLSLIGVPDGSATITATATDFVGGTATTMVTITVMQTPPAAPNANLIFGEPPNNGLSLVHGLPGAVGSGLLVTISDVVSHASTSTTAGSDGSFATNLPAAVNDTLSLTATDVVGNVSTQTLVTVRSTPSLPPSAGNTSLVYQGDLVDRVGLTSGAYTPDGLNDAVFTLSLDIGAGITRTISYITLQGNGMTRSTQGGGLPLGVAADTGSPLFNDLSTGAIGFPISGGATLTLFVGDGGFILAGATYTATAVFTDGSQFVGSYTNVAPADRQYVAHSATISASPATVTVNGAAPGTTTLTITNILDINGSIVPDGAMIALSAANMASNDPTGNGIVSAGGAIVGGTPSTNNTNFQVFTIQNGMVTATYSSQPVTPASIMGALSVIQMQAADSNGNVLGMQAVSTLDLNIRASTDQAVVAPVPSSLFGDRVDRRSQFTVQVTNGSGTPVPDGTPVVISAASCAGFTPQSGCISSVGGQILGGASSPAGSGFELFTTVGGVVQGTYSSAGVGIGDLQLGFATIQVFASNASGFYTSRNAIGTATIAITGAGSEEIAVTPNSVPYVFPAEPVTILVHHEHDMRANLAPDGSNIIVTAVSCALFTGSGSCVNSAGGSIVDGTPSPNNASLKFYALEHAQATATYTPQSASGVPNTGQANLVNIQVQMADDQGNSLDRTAAGVAPLELLGPGNAVGGANPASVLGDGGIHTSTVTFTPILDAFGNTIPNGSNIIASAASCAGFTASGGCVNSAGGQVTNGTASPSGSSYSVLTVQNGSVVVDYADQSVVSSPGQIQTANVQLMPSDGNGNLVSRTVLGSVPVQVAGLTSATGTASPASVYADGSDQRTTVTVSNFKDASGNPVSDGTLVGVTASSCATFTPSDSCNSSAGGVIIGGSAASFSSTAQIFTITNGQVSFPYSAQGVSVPTGQQTATVQIEAVTPQGAQISRTAVATVNVQLLALGSGSVAATPSSILADGASHTSRIVVSNLVGSDGVTPVPDGSKVGLSVASCAAFTTQSACITSLGGALSSAGTSPGDGTPAPNNSAFAVFTVAGGQVQAIYSDSGLTSGVNQTQTASVAVVAADPNGNVLTRTSNAIGTIQLQGTTSATASGPASISISAGGTATITFSGIKDAAGNTVPDGTSIAVSAVSCASFTPSSSCNNSSGGTIVGGTPSPSDSRFQVFTTQGGAISVTYSPSGASVGAATIQAVPAEPGGTLINRTSLFGGTWAIMVTN